MLANSMERGMLHTIHGYPPSMNQMIIHEWMPPVVELPTHGWGAKLSLHPWIKCFIDGSGII